MPNSDVQKSNPGQGNSTPLVPSWYPPMENDGTEWTISARVQKIVERYTRIVDGGKSELCGNSDELINDIAGEFLGSEVAQANQAKSIGELKLFLNNAKQRIKELEEELRDEKRGGMNTLDGDGVQQTI